MIDLKGKRVVITGAGGGVGTALCSAFAAVGAHVIGCDLAADSVPATCAETHAFDLRDTATVQAATQAILLDGVPDSVVSNAGWTRAETLVDVGPEAIAAEMDCNFTGVVHLTMALLPAMRAQSGDRSFVFISSVNALAHFGNPVYSAAKAACMAWSRAIATEEGPHGIRANVVVPASIRTHARDHRLKTDPGILDRMSRLYPLGRIVTPEEVANTVLFLASPLATGITGSAINVDAGLAASNLPFLEAISSLEG